MPCFLFLFLLFLFRLGWTESPRTYNFWAKERIRYLDNKVNLNPENPHLRVLLASAYYENRMNRKAKDQLNKALQLQPFFPEAHTNLGSILQAEGRLQEAQRHYTWALSQDSTTVEALLGLGTLLCRKNREGEGLVYLERALVHDPDRTDARYNMAIAYHKAGDFTTAIGHFKAVLLVDAQYTAAAHALARAYFSQGLVHLLAKQPLEALSVLRLAQDLGYDDENMAYARGLGQMDRANYVAAEKEFRRAIDLEPLHVPALHNLGLVCERLDRPNEAVRFFQRVQELTPQMGSIEATKDAIYDVHFLLK